MRTDPAGQHPAVTAARAAPRLSLPAGAPSPPTAALRRRPLRPGPGPARTTPLTRRTPLRGFASLRASADQRAKVRGHRCLACGAPGVEPAHLISRALGGCDHPDCVVPLCRACHRALDRHELDLLLDLEPGWRAELAHAVAHAGLIGTLRRVSPRT